MRISLPAIWSDGDIKISPEGAVANEFQSIFSLPRSRSTESRACDPDRALVIQSQEGDLAAFAELIRKHQRMIHSLTYRMTGSLADAEDLAQETFISAHRQIGSYRGASKFSTWLYRIAINACLSWRRRENLRAEATTNWVQTNSTQQESVQAAPLASKCGERLHAALLRLPAKQRAAIMLTLHDGLNHAEAAEVLNCSETTISWRVFAAKRKLERWLKREGEQE
jgi:RNA polymerase sigma-70 factor, ECF subfamily